MLRLFAKMYTFLLIATIVVIVLAAPQGITGDQRQYNQVPFARNRPLTPSNKPSTQGTYVKILFWEMNFSNKFVFSCCATVCDG